MSKLYLQCECGLSIGQQRWRSGKRDCVECALARGITYNLQVNRKQGPGWEAYKARLSAMIAEDSKAISEEDHGG